MALGLTKSRVSTEVRNGRWQRMAAGVVLTRPDPPTRSDWIRVGLILGGATSALTGWDAVRLFGLGSDRPPTTDSAVVVLTTSGKNRRCGELRLRPTARAFASTRTTKLDRALPPISVVHVARAVADTALCHTRLEPVRAMVTQAVQRQLCTYEQLADELETAPRNGSGYLRLALSDVALGARSIAEAEALTLLRRPDIPPFQANAPILDSRGSLVAVADVLWEELRAIVEIDSREHHFSEFDWKRTMARHNKLTSLGYAVAHYPPSAIRAGRERWADEVSAWLSRRAAQIS